MSINEFANSFGQKLLAQEQAEAERKAAAAKAAEQVAAARAFIRAESVKQYQQFTAAFKSAINETNKVIAPKKLDDSYITSSQGGSVSFGSSIIAYQLEPGRGLHVWKKRDDERLGHAYHREPDLLFKFDAIPSSSGFSFVWLDERGHASNIERAVARILDLFLKADQRNRC